ncbi:IclR family transcriptional regulator [Diaphorobacter aerolatus]|uniref:IclR family transcriptional regulator n=1 Tax=Diaphorobacter aerolatus TaxID=1288495 RepID=A0A7H0GG37_9BURK|nr:IclR family transcriptional regulator [Diaphorobacter aerolatus]QNP47253.1 IclR family transcriptional regulator [Diaphorobacter aerolatus]
MPPRKSVAAAASPVKTVLGAPLDADAASEPNSVSERALSVLDFVAQSGRAGLMDVAGALNLPKATASRMCSNLEAQHWLTRDANDRSFQPGPRLLKMALATLKTDPRRELRHHILAELVEEIDETCNLTLLEGLKVRYLDRVETHWPLRTQFEAGSYVPLHATASGKMYIAMMSPEKRAAVLEHANFAKLTPYTLTRRDELEAACEQIRADGHSFEMNEFMLGLIGMAVPILDDKGECRATMALHAPTARMQLEGALAVVPALKRAAERVKPLLF